MSQVSTLDITAIAAGGDGVARHEGLVVFVPRTAPGDRARVRVQPKGRFARGTLVALEQPSPSRVAPPCVHYERDRCGGCQLQHLSLAAQRAAKAQIVHDAFTRIAKRDVPLPEVRGAGDGWRYRRKLTLAMRRTRDGWMAGMHRAGAPDELVPIDDCHITDASVVAGFRDVLASAAPLLPNAPSLRLAIRRAGDDLLCVVEGGLRWREAAAFAEAVPSLAAVWWVTDEGRRTLVLDRRASYTAGASFVQVNEAVAAMLAEHAVACAMRHTPATIVDGYAGTGDVAAMLHARGVRVTAIELDADAADVCGRRLTAPSAVVTARVEDALPSALPADVVLLNPPRAGVDAQVAATLSAAAVKPRAIIYVSCDPATLARDVARLPGYTIASLTCFDMFPQTAHVETVCELVAEAP